ncbi:jg24088 [Pararge aegeria aegeria]|uniref:Jg24088 protein n=1 Tax=Pararge aegeria aegeria TaxID=348720 RepID=A0A8S4RK49_9NEOP|nr:jg24088 [Pararge aegeria aegeria]
MYFSSESLSGRWRELCWAYLYLIKSEIRKAVEASRKAEVEMDGAHSSENRCTSMLGFQGARMATPHWSTQRWSAPNEEERRHQTSRWPL